MRVLIVRTSALGDIVHTLPVLTALKRHLPHSSSIGWVVEQPFAPLVAGHPDVDRTIVIRTRRWRREPFSAATLTSFRKFVAELDDFSADAVLDLMGNHKAATIAALSMADRRIGLARRYRREPSSAIWLNEGCTPVGEHAVDRALSLLPALGLPLDAADFGASRIFPAARPEENGAPYFVILPGAGWSNKRYPHPWWGEVARMLAESTGLACRLLPGPGEEPLAEEVAAHSSGAAEIVAPGGLEALAASLRGARLVLGGDTGPVHLAHALEVPVLCLMGPTDPRRNGPYQAPELALWKELPCSFCHKRFDEPKACMLEIPPRRVAERAESVLGLN